MSKVSSGGTDWSGYLNKGFDALGSVGDFLGGKTKTTSPSSTGGFKSNPQEVQDFLLKVLFPDIQKSYNHARPSVMKRQYTAEEANDPMFGSQARYYMQQRANADAMQTPSAETKPMDGEAGGEVGGMMLRQLLSDGGTTGLKNANAQYLDSMDNKSLGEMSKLVNSGKIKIDRDRYGMNQVNGNNPDFTRLLQESLARKAM